MIATAAEASPQCLNYGIKITSVSPGLPGTLNSAELLQGMQATFGDTSWGLQEYALLLLVTTDCPRKARRVYASSVACLFYTPMFEKKRRH